MQLVTWSNLPQFYAGAYRDTLAKAISKGNNFTILKYQEKPIRLEDYFRLLNEILILDANAKNLNSTKIKQFIIDALQSKEIIQKAKDQGLEEKIFHPFTQNSILKMKLVDLYDQEMIKSKIPKPTETDLKKFYQENEIKLYFHPEKINLYLMFYSDKSEAEKVLDKINASTSFEEISNHWFVKTYIKNRQGEIQPHFGEEPMIFGKIGFELAQSEVADVLEYDDPEKGLQYAIIKCARRTPAKQLTYEEARKTISEDYKKYYRDKIRETVKNKLWERYDVYINEEYLTEIINKIDAKLSAATS
jgi:peptidyl-prolyl cis-trans isomerase C